MKKGPIPRSCVQTLGAYPMGAAVGDPSLELSHLDNNEHWESPSPGVMDAVRDALRYVHVYPEVTSAKLREAIGELHNLDSERIVIGNGSSELISMLTRIYCEQGDEVVVGPYSYMYFRTASTIAGANIIMPAGGALSPSVDEFLDCLTPKTRIVFVDNPQNPIGNCWGAAEVKKLHAGLPPNVLLVLDSAYAEYVGSDNYVDGSHLVDTTNNCVMLRTFSKIYGLASLRIGWAYASSEISRLLHQVRQPNNLSSLSIAAALSSIGEQQLVAARRQQNDVSRTELIQLLTTEVEMTVLPSFTNFVLARISPKMGMSADEIDTELRKTGILIRSMSGYGLPDHIRVTVGEHHHHRRLIDALALLKQ